MHSTLVRVQNVFGYFTTMAFIVAGLAAFSVVLFPQTPSVDLKLRNVQVIKGRPHYYSTKKEEYAHIKFDLDADFTSLFNWNTKQLFVYVLANYPSTSPNTPASQSIIWDQIIPAPATPFSLSSLRSPPAGSKKSKNSKSKSKKSTTPAPAVHPGILHLPNQKPKYQITSPTGRIAETANVTLEIGWNVQPWVGALVWASWEDWGRWGAVRGGRSERFRFPALKGKKSMTVVEGGPTKAAEASPVL
ncbi:MAG: hypothetical protein M1834_004329 [Cirrosporium novae-zelandiae]|nr:MAG: hypothetical protein M1834_004329 [Cirrosporium novae-zelandiae]